MFPLLKTFPSLICHNGGLITWVYSYSRMLQVLPFALLTSFYPRLHVRVGIANTIVMSSSSRQQTSRSGNLSLVHVCRALIIFNRPNFILPELILISTFKWSRSLNLKWSLRWEQEIFPYIFFNTHCIHFSSLGLTKAIGILILEMAPLHVTLNHRHVSHKVINSFNVNNSAWLFYGDNHQSWMLLQLPIFFTLIWAV